MTEETIGTKYDMQCCPKTDPVAIRKWYDIQMLTFKTEIFSEHNVQDNPKADKCMELAWSYGHASGFRETENYFEELVELIK